MATPIDGLVRLRGSILRLSHNKDVENAHKGIGLVVYVAQVITVAPDLSIQVSGAINLTGDSFLLSVANDDLVLPQHIRLAVGDWIGIVPMAGGRRWWVLDKMNDNVVSGYGDARLGFNGDKNGGNFAGVQVTVPDGDASGSGSILVTGSQISITSFGGASVVIDGINFKAHVHTDPQGGNTGVPH